MSRIQVALTTSISHWRAREPGININPYNQSVAVSHYFHYIKPNLCWPMGFKGVAFMLNLTWCSLYHTVLDTLLRPIGLFKFKLLMLSSSFAWRQSAVLCYKQTKSILTPVHQSKCPLYEEEIGALEHKNVIKSEIALSWKRWEIYCPKWILSFDLW